MENIFPYCLWNYKELIEELQNTKEKNYCKFSQEYETNKVNPQDFIEIQQKKSRNKNKKNTF